MSSLFMILHHIFQIKVFLYHVYTKVILRFPGRRNNPRPETNMFTMLIHLSTSASVIHDRLNSHIERQLDMIEKCWMFIYSVLSNDPSVIISVPGITSVPSVSSKRILSNVTDERKTVFPATSIFNMANSVTSVSESMVKSTV